ncbi:MAG: hypothetical protein VYC40_01690 [Pseudomonadota bacterium]|nr:hypothetical protein [Pseudomonadota bacterium]
MRVKVGDVVLPKNFASFDTDPGYGVVLDTYEDERGLVYFEVGWPMAESNWWGELELELISES